MTKEAQAQSWGPAWRWGKSRRHDRSFLISGARDSHISEPIILDRTDTLPSGVQKAWIDSNPSLALLV